MMRTSISQSYHVWHFTLILAALIFGASTVAFADTTPLPLTWQNLKNDVSLGKQITLEAKHLPLGILLMQVSEQSGVKISLSPNSNLSLKLVTARISQMNLYNFMDAIGRTYNGYWFKASDGTFVLISKDRDTIEEGVSQLGTPIFFRYRDRLLPSDAEKMPGNNDIKTRIALYQKVLLSTDSKALQSEKGVPLHSLPPELVDALKSQYQKANAVNLLLKYSAYKEISDDDIVRITLKQDTALADSNAALGENISQPLNDKIITIEVLGPDKKQVLNAASPWSLLGRWIPSNLQEIK